MGFIKKHAPSITAAILIILYLATRFYNILGLPIFTDEAIYIRWSQIALQDANQRFISLTDGKQPMYVWIAMTLLRFIHDPLMAGRLVSILSGLGTAFGIFFLTREMFNSQKTAFLASFMYVLFPFALVYDRIALYDSLVAAFIVWSLYFEILLVKHLRLDLALILGMVVGAGMLTKSNADFALVLLPFSLLLFNFQIKDRNKKLIRWIMYAVVSAVLANIIYSVLRLSPYFYIISQKNYLFIYSSKEWIMHPFAVFSNNIVTFTNWLSTYLTIPFIILILASFFMTYKFTREKLVLLAWFIVPLISLAFFGRLIYPRFLLFMTMPLIPLAAFSLMTVLDMAKNNITKTLLVVCFLSMFCISDYYIITDFKNAPIPQSDKGQFLTGWPSGVGVVESVKFFEEQARSQKIFIGTQGTFGLMPFSLQMYLDKNPNVTIEGFWPTKDQPPKEALDASKKMPAYFVFYQACPDCSSIGLAPMSWPVRKIYQVEKIEKGQFFTLYQILQK